MRFVPAHSTAGPKDGSDSSLSLILPFCLRVTPESCYSNRHLPLKQPLHVPHAAPLEREDSLRGLIVDDKLSARWKALW